MSKLCKDIEDIILKKFDSNEHFEKKYSDNLIFLAKLMKNGIINQIIS